jgi:steroid delta-isomerase-like uncharacterized protein
MSEQNKAIVNRFVSEIWNAGDLSSAAELIADDYRHHSSQLAPIVGRDGLAAMVADLRSGFPDARFTVEKELAEGDMVAHRWIFQGTHSADWNGIPATGRKVEVHGTAISHLKDGKIVEHTADWDAMGMMQQLGVIEG